MQTQSNISESQEKQSVTLKTPLIDLFLHEGTVDDIEFKLINDPKEVIRSRLIFDPLKDQKIKLNVTQFKQHSTYKYFIYNEITEPEMVEFKNCVVCNETMVDVSALSDIRSKTYLTLGLCPSCGFFQHTKRPPKQWYAQFYRKQWNPQDRDEKIWPQNLAPDDGVLSNVFAYCRPGSKILEIGSGWGRSLLAFSKYKYQAFGVEATEHRSQFIREHLNIPCYTGEGEDVPVGSAPYEKESFDLVFSTNVLEHVYSTRQVIEHVHQLLKPNGMAYLEVPIYYQENLTLNTHGISHTCNFSHANFLYLCQSIGFDLVKDFSTMGYASLLLRKAPALSQEQAASKIAWMKTFLPHRGLAHIFEKNGLAFLMNKPAADYSCELAWHLGQEGCFLELLYDVPQESVLALHTIKNAILQRKDIRDVSKYLPLQYTYPVEGAPIWYY